MPNHSIFESVCSTQCLGWSKQAKARPRHVFSQQWKRRYPYYITERRKHQPGHPPHAAGVCIGLKLFVNCSLVTVAVAVLKLFERSVAVERLERFELAFV